MNGGCRAVLVCGGWPDDGDGAELFVKEQSWLGHDQVGLELVCNAGTSGTRIGIDSTVEVRECEVAVGYIGRVTCFVVPGLEVGDLGAADAQQDPQDFQRAYLLRQHGV